MYLEWTKSASGDWHSLDEVDLQDVAGRGVYVIWRSNAHILRPSTVVKVGRGNIALRLALDRADRTLNGDGERLYVTWAEVADAVAVGVQAYLTQLLRPIAADAALEAASPIAVNLPVSA